MVVERSESQLEKQLDVIPAPVPGPAPNGWHIVKRRNTPLWVSGLVLFNVAHLTMIVTGIAANSAAVALVGAIPVIGPLIDGIAGIVANNAAIAALGLVDLAAQIAGIAMFGTGLRAKVFWVRDGMTLGIVPVAPATQAGLSLLASF
jgi:hypothetical protein